MAGLSEDEIKRQLQQMDPYEFEELVAEIWELQGYQTTVRKGSGDRGIDVEATKQTPAPQKVLIQAKRYADSNKIGVNEVRNYATLYQQVPDADTIVVVTTSSFTSEAERLADDLNVKLVAGDQISQLVIKNIESFDGLSEYINTNNSEESVYKESGESVEYEEDSYIDSDSKISWKNIYQMDVPESADELPDLDIISKGKEIKFCDLPSNASTKPYDEIRVERLYNVVKIGLKRLKKDIEHNTLLSMDIGKRDHHYHFIVKYSSLENKYLASKTYLLIDGEPKTITQDDIGKLTEYVIGDLSIGKVDHKKFCASGIINKCELSQYTFKNDVCILFYLIEEIADCNLSDIDTVMYSLSNFD